MYYCNEPELIFYGGTRTAVAGALIGVDALSIGLHVLFIMAIYKMAGWESDFAFVLLITMSAIAIFRYMDDIVCYMLALKYVDFCTNHHLFTTLGSIKLSAYFSTILIALLMSIHRMIYTLRATRASSLLTPRFMKAFMNIHEILPTVSRGVDMRATKSPEIYRIPASHPVFLGRNGILEVHEAPMSLKDSSKASVTALTISGSSLEKVGVLVLVCGFFAAVIVVANPDDVHYHFVPSYLSYDDLSESTWEILRL
ncbi:hypothetical protein RB195_005809 [Necator americanus]